MQAQQRVFLFSGDKEFFLYLIFPKVRQSDLEWTEFDLNPYTFWKMSEF